MFNSASIELRDTLFVGSGRYKFAIIKRKDLNQFYVECPLHCFSDGSKRRKCAKAISAKQPDSDCQRRLMHWCLSGCGRGPCDMFVDPAAISLRGFCCEKLQ